MSKSGQPVLTWAGKGAAPPVPAVLVEERALGHGDPAADNRLIHGDNRAALAALAGELAGRVKCAYLDPPYGDAEHCRRLSDIYLLLSLIKPLLRPDGLLFVQIDGRGLAYLKVLLDEVFGRRRWVNDVVWKRRGGSANPHARLNNVTDFLLVYARGRAPLHPVRTRDDPATRAYVAQRFVHTHGGRRFMLAPVERNAALGLRERLRYEYGGYTPRYGWMMSRAKLERLDAAGGLHWNGRGRPNRRVFLDDYPGRPVGNLWTDVKVINPMAQERLDFDGQKPEALLERVLRLSTAPGDLVLDAYAGSGTTGAVAHKMGRRWVMVERGAHCAGVIRPRLARVVDGADPAGVTAAVGWKGGGGFRYFRAAPGVARGENAGAPPGR